MWVPAIDDIVGIDGIRVVPVAMIATIGRDCYDHCDVRCGTMIVMTT